MRAALVSFSRQGGILAAWIREILRSPEWGESPESGKSVEAYALPKFAWENGQIPIEKGLASWCRARWETEELLIFVGASGIAVRTIAPCVKSKATDPAVLVVDERGQFVISLLSGHLGGANAWAEQLAVALGAVPVITTATDVEGRFAVDVWAKANNLAIGSLKQAKEVSAAVLAGEPVGFFCDGIVEGEVPPELTQIADPADWPEEQLLIVVSPRDWRSDQKRILQLTPRCVALGLGCRRGVSAEALRVRVDGWLTAAGIRPESLERAASIDVKKNETGILTYCKEKGIPYETYTAEELLHVPGEFASSAFVQSTVGVDNVCERAAALAAGGGAWLMRKQAGDGVTAAAACRRWRVRF
ncbi:MAG: cobalamin biosynthesis protein [Lachnospiraceae bacterium]|nr:cobalamin biosynthesis protein [Lachnospiraceae bacterium]